MKTLLSLLAVAALSGCAVYPPVAYNTYDGSVVVPYATVPPAYIYGDVYPFGFYGAYSLGYYRGFPRYASPRLHAPGMGHGPRGGFGGGAGGSHRH